MKIVFENEGIYSNDPNDPGGETFLGISRHYFPNWEGWKLIDTGNFYTLTIKEVKNSKIYPYVLEFYFNNFWKKLHMDDIPDSIKEIYFDSAINMGIKRAIKILQMSIDTLPDGIIGPITLKTLKVANEKLLYERFKINRIGYYAKICNENRKLEKFLLGWINRTLRF